MVRSAQIVHLSYVKISTISKWTKTSFQLTLVAKEYHRVRKNDFWAYGTFGVSSAPILHRN
jgi:hypothetical protein